MTYDDVEEQMDLSELKLLVKLVPRNCYLSARILNMLWVNFSNDQEANCLKVDQEAINRFAKWISSGNDADAWS